jgi:hypothetical protein
MGGQAVKGRSNGGELLVRPYICVRMWDMCSKQLDSDMLAADVPEGQADEESK